jgi:biotin-dependent carboxylase-like uncharacterized protein
VLEVIAPGPLATVQDLGRPGYAHLGVPRSGAADRPALGRANALVGNAAGAAGVEVTLGGLRVRFTVAATIALTGAPAAPEMDRALEIPAGGELRLRAPRTGLRTYLAVAGGIDVPPVLGSRATDVLSGLGPAPLRAGDLLPIGAVLAVGGSPHSSATAPQAGVRNRLVVLPGPRADWFAPAALAALCSAPYTVTAASNRVGLRLAGPLLARRIHAELPPEGMVEGALQVPPDGQPVLFGADHPVTGGYPVIGVVDAASVAVAAQARPGAELRFALAGRL